MAKSFECIGCSGVFDKTGRNQKRCAPCAQAAQKQAIHAWNVRTGNYTGTGSGAHNTPGELHPQWNGGESLFVNRLAPAYFRKVRYCERCGLDLKGEPPGKRAVHHKDHNRKNNSEGNFELLCKRCHQVEHECWRNLPNNGGGEGATTIPKGSRAKRPEAHDTLVA